MAARPFVTGRVLDVGCGSGNFADYVAADRYVGVDIDEESLTIAREAYPAHQFQKELPVADELFDTIISLAVIEHVREPITFMSELVARLAPNTESRILCTTPHPTMGWIHAFGASFGLFSRQTSEEHE